MEWAVASFSEGVPVRRGEKSMRGMKESESEGGVGFGRVAEGAMLLVAWSITRFGADVITWLWSPDSQD